ncbi:CAP domain-containing protein [Actinomycetospora sp. NBRC 106378]|uniref:CAP domain-containing protein n=1 Tax=Actinomycetospora sp. NBRC 106378 TaxID=3032208 RepID=UPI0024A20EFB|nr:CAP domain-containing protein [Actinomycetospora sp. NBRC 106378]GLZ53289.1 hypothetical protein Acsp07_29060 [Actinomycetospora sp. NBRC 106378]
MGLHRFEHDRRRRLALGLGAAAVVLGVVVAVVTLRPSSDAVQDASAAAALPVAAPAVPLAVPPALPALPVLPPSPAATTTTAASTTTTTTTSTTTRRSTTRAAAPAVGTGPTGRVLALVNAERTKAGCGAVAGNAALNRAAADYAALMARTGTFSHTGPDGSDFADRVRAAGYDDPGGENIAQGQTSADEVMDDWMNSPGHRRNILDCSFHTLGVGESDDYWVQEFGR